MTEIQIVTDFLSALEDLDIDRAMTYAAPGIVYQNVPLPPARGLPAVEKTLRAMSRYGTGFEARVNNIASNGPVVLTERTDVLEVGAWRAEFWVCGTFEVHDDRITLWRDGSVHLLQQRFSMRSVNALLRSHTVSMGSGNTCLSARITAVNDPAARRRRRSARTPQPRHASPGTPPDLRLAPFRLISAAPGWH